MIYKYCAFECVSEVAANDIRGVVKWKPRRLLRLFGGSVGIHALYHRVQKHTLGKKRKEKNIGSTRGSDTVADTNAQAQAQVQRQTQTQTQTQTQIQTYMQ